ncbi:MAG: hypothetical protein ACQR33_01435 [Candidatus Saccharibacteria bacterium]
MFVALFDQTGSPVKISDLRDADELITQCDHQKLIQKLFPEDGVYWLVWDSSDDSSDKRGSGFYCITATKRPRLLDHGHCGISYADHSADYAHFDLAAELETYLNEINQHPIMPANVLSIVRERVRYQEGAQHPIEGEDRYMIQTASPKVINLVLRGVIDKDATVISREIGDRKVSIFELASAISAFLGNDDVDFKHTECLYATVSPLHWLRLVKLQRLLGGIDSAETAQAAV